MVNGKRAFGWSVLGAMWLSACGETLPVSEPEVVAREDVARASDAALASDAAHQHGEVVALLREGERVAGVDGEERTFRLTPARPTMQLGLMLTGAEREAVQWRARGINGVWSAWQDAEITWSENGLHVGRAFLAAPGDQLELRASASAAELSVELFERPNLVPSTLTRDLPRVSDIERQALEQGELLTHRQQLAPSNLVISRAAWGARNPDKICGTVVAPYRMSVHHTASPDNDGGDPAARMRQMQAFHIDSRGWCDIGYHFVVSQSGKIYQGRSDERRPGAHVANQNSGNIGVSFIGNYQVAQPPQAQLDAAKKLLDWARKTYDIKWDRAHVKGHREWPGQGTSCPGDNLLAKLPELMSGTAPEPDPTPKKGQIVVEANFLPSPALEDRLMQGSSAGLVDPIEGATFQAELVISNKSDGPLRGISFGYLIENPHLKATGYTIQSDAPAFDRKSWKTNDADGAPGNPARDALGAEGKLDLFAMAAGETKRVLLDLEASRYSLGAIDHPDVRAWVVHINDVYADQESWGATPSLNTTGERLRAFAQLDVLSSKEWQFDAGEAELSEGWRACAAGAQPGVDVERGALTLSSAAGCVRAPAWTSVEAARWDQLVLRSTQAEPVRLKVAWGSGEASALHEGVVELPAGEEQAVVLAMGEQYGWVGTIERLELTPLSGELALDALFFQSGAGQKVGSARESYVSLPVTPLDAVGGGATPSPNPGTSDPTPGSPGMGTKDPAMEDGSLSDDDDVYVKEGCAQAGLGGGNTELPHGLGGLVLFGLALWRRRRAIVK